MTQEEALNTLMKMRAWRAWGKEQKEEERPEMPEQKEVDKAFDVCIELLQKPLLSSNLDEAAKKYRDFREECGIKDPVMLNEIEEAYYAGAEWMAKQGYSYEDKVYLLDGGDTYESYPGLDGEGEKQCIDKAVKVGYLKVGDKVIVQIRKK